MDNCRANSRAGPLLWSGRKLPKACDHGETCDQPECLPTGLGTSHHLRTWYPVGDQALWTQPGVCWPTDHGCVRSGLYKVARSHTFQEGTNPGGQPVPTFSISRGEPGISIVLTNLSSSTLPGTSLSQEIVVVHLPSCIWNPMNCNMPDLAVPYHLLKFAQVHVHCIGDAIQPSHSLSPSSPSALNLAQNQRLFQWVSCCHQMINKLDLELQHHSF